MYPISFYSDKITLAKSKLYELTWIIYNERNLSVVEDEIGRASKIRFGLLALNQYPDFTSAEELEQIIIGLNYLSGAGNQQTIPTLTI